MTYFFNYALRLLGNDIVHEKRCRDGVICAVFVCSVSTPSCCGFWHCHPYIPVHFWKMYHEVSAVEGCLAGFHSSRIINICGDGVDCVFALKCLNTVIPTYCSHTSISNISMYLYGNAFRATCNCRCYIPVLLYSQTV